jgi:uncharacterized protein YggE
MDLFNRTTMFLLTVIIFSISCTTTNSTPSQSSTNTNTDTSGSAVSLDSGTIQPQSLNDTLRMVSGNVSRATLEQQGVLVVGTGSVQLDPDLVLLTIGVESREKMVSMAQAKASVAMEAIISSLDSQGVSKDDMRTQRFDIQPIISYQGHPNPVQNVDGYKVSNTLVVRISDIERVGEMIDSAVVAGGDLTRVQSISFVAEDQSAARIKARTLATENAIVKANQFAEVLSIKVGQPIFVSELGADDASSRIYSLQRFAMADESMSAATVPIIAGEIGINSQVQILFSIE